MARRPADGSLTGVLVVRPELKLPLWYTSHRAIGRAALLLFVVLLLRGMEPRPGGGQEVLTKHSAVPPSVDALRGRGTVYHSVSEKYIELTPNVGAVQSTTTPFGRKSELVFHGRRAHHRITDRQPVLYSSYSASELQLVRLKPGSDIKA